MTGLPWNSTALTGWQTGIPMTELPWNSTALTKLELLSALPMDSGSCFNCWICLKIASAAPLSLWAGASAY